MDALEFRRILDLFPIVRSRDYHADSVFSNQSTARLGQDNTPKDWKNSWGEEEKMYGEHQGINLQDPFWKKLKLAAEKKVGAAEAERFCQAFQRIHKKLVYEELSLDAARSFVDSSTSSQG